MDFLTSIWAFLSGTLLPFLFVLTVVVFIHEMGHFLVARWNGIKVEAFSIGFGPELLARVDRKGTRWRLAAIPLGGYVRFFGDADAASRPDNDAMVQMPESERALAYENQAVWRRALVTVAGPAANFILAIVIYTAMFSIYPDVGNAPVVDRVIAGSAAEEAGLEPGDRFVSVNDRDVTTFFDVQRITTQSAGVPMEVVIERSGGERSLQLVPRMTERTDEFGNTYKTGLIGVIARSDETTRTVTELNVFQAFAKALDRTWFIVTSTFNFLGELILGKQDASELRGPIGIGQITSDVATLGFASLVGLMAVLSVSIGILNLFPIPMLDGGHLVFYAIEWVRGRKLSERSQEYAYRFGMACVLGLMVFATSNDVLRIFAS